MHQLTTGIFVSMYSPIWCTGVEKTEVHPNHTV